MFKEIFVLCAFVAVTFAIPAPEAETLKVNSQPIVADVELVASDDLEGAESAYGGYGRGFGGYGGGYGRGFGGYGGGYGRGYGGYGGGYGRGGFGGYGGHHHHRGGYWG